jgi:hypothetical protein
MWKLSLIVLMMEAVCSSETLVSMYQTTRRNIPEDSHSHFRHCENLKSHPVNLYVEAITHRSDDGGSKLI